MSSNERRWPIQGEGEVCACVSVGGRRDASPVYFSIITSAATDSQKTGEWNHTALR